MMIFTMGKERPGAAGGGALSIPDAIPSCAAAFGGNFPPMPTGTTCWISGSQNNKSSNFFSSYKMVTDRLVVGLAVSIGVAFFGILRPKWHPSYAIKG